MSLPPAGCEYLSPTDVHMIIDGLPPGTQIHLAPIHRDFVCNRQRPSGFCNFPDPDVDCKESGGSLGGEQECSESQLTLQATCSGNCPGGLAGYNRILNIPVSFQTHVGPRTPGQTPQSFDTQMQFLQGTLNPSDPDFSQLMITAGNGFGMPSPGHTTLTRNGPPGSNWAVDSFFDITYRIDYTGRPGGPLGGMHGSTTGTIRMIAVGGGGGATGACCLPTGACIQTTLPQCSGQSGTFQGPGTSCANVACPPPATCAPDPAGQSCAGNCPGPLPCNSTKIRYDSINNTYHILSCDCTATCHVQRPPAAVGGEPFCVNDCPTAGDVCQIRVTPTSVAGVNDYACVCVGGAQCVPSANGQQCSQTTCPTPGQQCIPVCAKYNPQTGQSQVINCDCRDPASCQIVLPSGPPTPGPGGGDRGAGGNPCVVADAGGTVMLPPVGCAYLTGDEVHMIIDGLPPGTTIELAPIHRDFACHSSDGTQLPCSAPIDPMLCEDAGGDLGGEHDCFASDLHLDVQGTGGLATFGTTLNIPVVCEVFTGPRTAGNPIQEFPTKMYKLQGQLPPGDPDFDLLKVTAGDGNGLPSPGHTTLMQLPGGNWAVDSFFDITYRIEFHGRPGGRLDGLSGITVRTVHMGTGNGPRCQGNCPPGTACHESRMVDAAGNLTICCDCVPIQITQACCFESGGCQDLSATECMAVGGTPQGANTSCANFVCPSPSCAPNAGGTGCLNTICPTTGDKCVPHCAQYNPVTGNSHVVDCDCRPSSNCHVVLPHPIAPPGENEGGGDRGGAGNPCVVNDAGGTVVLPPVGCQYLSADEVHVILDGLPAGTTIELAPIHKDFICHRQPGAPPGVCDFTPLVDCEQSGGSLGGREECAESTLELNLECVGTCPGGLGGYTSTKSMPVSFETHVGPRTVGDPVQSFDTEMFLMQGQLPPGDPDFDLLRITAGTGFGLPSPGHTTLTRLPNGQWTVDSFFDITYRIDFVGHAGGPFGGMSGSTTGTIRMATGSGPKCQGNCPPGTTCHETRSVDANGNITVCCDCVPTECGPDPVDHRRCLPVECTQDGYRCVPACAHFNPISGESFVTSCECRGPEACHLDIIGVPPDRGAGSNPCVVPDNGSGTVTLPPAGCGYLSPDEYHMIVDGLPAGTVINFAPEHRAFVCGGAGHQVPCTNPLPPGCEGPGGELGGQHDCFLSELHLEGQGTGSLSGFSTILNIPVSCEVHTAPRTPAAPIQEFNTEMYSLQGQLPAGDPDFDLLRVTGGNAFGLPSPGHTTLTRLPGNQWAVDSFFDITYRIDFVGSSTGPLAGRSGSTTATIRMSTGGAPQCVSGNCPTGTQCRRMVTINADGSVEVCCNCIPITCSCPGDMNGDGQHNGKDIGLLINCFVNGPCPSTTAPCICADVVADGVCNLLDIEAFVQQLLTHAPCP